MVRQVQSPGNGYYGVRVPPAYNETFATVKTSPRFPVPFVGDAEVLDSVCLLHGYQTRTGIFPPSPFRNDSVPLGASSGCPTSFLANAANDLPSFVSRRTVVFALPAIEILR